MQVNRHCEERSDEAIQPGDHRVKAPAVYLMANKLRGTLYVGVTSDLVRRAGQHRTAALSGFTARYGCTRLVWFEMHADMQAAITREKQIKGGPRARKIALIEALNPNWRDLYEEIV